MPDLRIRPLRCRRGGTDRRAGIVEFIDAVTSGPNAVLKPERGAVFDNDGTLWTEKAMNTELHYLLEKWPAAAVADPSLVEKHPRSLSLVVRHDDDAGCG